MEQQNYAEAEPLMEQYLEISWEPYWKAVELVNGKINKFSRSEAEAALQKCKRMMKEESQMDNGANDIDRTQNMTHVDKVDKKSIE